MPHATGALALTTTDTTYLHAAAFLARYSGATRDAYGNRLRLFMTWCTQNGVDPITGITRPHLPVDVGETPVCVTRVARRPADTYTSMPILAPRGVHICTFRGLWTTSDRHRPVSKRASDLHKRSFVQVRGPL